MADRYEELEKLQRLRESGALTEDEFQAEKSKLLARGADAPDGADPGSQVRRLIALGVVILVLIAAVVVWMARGHDRSSEPAANASEAVNVVAPAETAAPPPRSDADRLANAFEAATGHRKSFTGREGDDVVTTAPIRIVQLPFGPALLTSQEIKDGCHACTGAIGVYYLREENEKTTVTGRWPKAVEGWGWGAAPSDWTLTDKFTQYPAIYASGGYMGQGVVTEGATLTELRPDGPVTSDLIGTGYNDEGAGREDRPICAVKGRIANVRRDRSFDVIVTGSVKAVDRYVKRNGKFVAASRIDWGLPCQEPGG